MFGITDLTAYLIGVVLIILLPGPNSLYCLTTGASQGKRAGFLAMGGIMLGDSILILATVLGAGTALKLHPAIFDAIKLIGGIYLAYLGGRLLMGAYYNFKNRHTLSNLKILPKPTKDRNPFYKAMTLSLTNPKGILFMLSFFVQFVRPDYPHPFLTFFILAVLLQIVSGAYLLLLIFSGQALATKFSSRPWLVVSSMGLIGLLFIGFGVNLWMSKL